MFSGYRDIRKHVFILTSSGKPVFSNLETNNEIVSMFSFIVAAASSLKNSPLHINMGTKSVSFLVVGELYLVCISSTLESYGVLRKQLSFMHDQLVFILTRKIHEIIRFDRCRDIRDLLGVDTDRCLQSSCSTDMVPISIAFNATECVSFNDDSNVYSRVDFLSRLHECIEECGALVGLLLSGDSLVAHAVSARGNIIDPSSSDLVILCKFVAYSGSGCVSEASPHTWVPICLPSFNDSMCVQAYIGRLEPSREFAHIDNLRANFYYDTHQAATLAQGSQQQQQPQQQQAGRHRADVNRPLSLVLISPSPENEQFARMLAARLKLEKTEGFPALMSRISGSKSSREQICLRLISDVNRELSRATITATAVGPNASGMRDNEYDDSPVVCAHFLCVLRSSQEHQHRHSSQEAHKSSRSSALFGSIETGAAAWLPSQYTMSPMTIAPLIFEFTPIYCSTTAVAEEIVAEADSIDLLESILFEYQRLSELLAHQSSSPDSAIAAAVVQRSVKELVHVPQSAILTASVSNELKTKAGFPLPYQMVAISGECHSKKSSPSFTSRQRPQQNRFVLELYATFTQQDTVGVGVGIGEEGLGTEVQSPLPRGSRHVWGGVGVGENDLSPAKTTTARPPRQLEETKLEAKGTAGLTGGTVAAATAAGSPRVLLSRRTSDATNTTKIDPFHTKSSIAVRMAESLYRKIQEGDTLSRLFSTAC